MSGQQIGTVVGGVIGAYFGAPQLGMAIGGLIGGAIDPTKIYGPHIGDGQAQSATDGSAISWVMGTMWVAGTIVDVGERQEFKVKQDTGKGSGTEQYNYEAHQNFSILVCESDELKGSTIDQVLMVEQDGKIVYDVRPGSTMLADSQKWLARNCIFYYGDEAQLPTPADEGAHGVGNAPAYRGVLRAFFTQFNVTAVGDRIPSFRFLVSAVGTTVIPAQSIWRYISGIYNNDPVDYSAPTIDDSGWEIGKAPFGNLESDIANVGQNAHAFNAMFSPDIATIWPKATTGWLRGTVSIPQGVPLRLIGWFDNGYKLYIGGVLVSSGAGGDGYGGTDTTIAAGSFPAGRQVVAIRCQDDGGTFNNVSYFDFALLADAGIGGIPLSSIAASISSRGGVQAIDTSELDEAWTHGYAIAKQMNAVNALGPLLGSYFAYASEYDSKINFHFYGADAVMTIDEADVLAENDANNGNVIENLRNNATEFPKRIIGQYYDPAQNYMPVTVMQTRRAAGITATGDMQMDIPIAMTADQAQQTVDKALKVAYAQLEGTLELSVTFAGEDNVYLSLAAGDPVIFRGKRWIVTEPIISNGYIKLTLQYDRQSAYTSDVQAIPGLDPTPPQSRYSGPTTLVPMNLPSLRTQDTYGVYLAAKGTNDQDSWRGCNVLVSYDDQQSWQNALVVSLPSVIGTLDAEIPSGGEPITLDIGDADQLESITDQQIAAQMNAFALGGSGGFEIGQFKTALQESGGDWEITDVSRGLNGTTEGEHVVGDPFVMLDSVYFLPIDLAFAGKTLYFKGVGFGESADDSNAIALVYSPDMTVIIDGGGDP